MIGPSDWTRLRGGSNPSCYTALFPDPTAISQSNILNPDAFSTVKYMDEFTEFPNGVIVRCSFLLAHGKFCHAVTQPCYSCLFSFSERRFYDAHAQHSRNLARSPGDFPKIMSLLPTVTTHSRYFYGAVAAELVGNITSAKAAVLCRLYVELSLSSYLVLTFLFLDLLTVAVIIIEVYTSIKFCYLEVIKDKKDTIYMDTSIPFITEYKPYYLDWSSPELDWSAEVDSEFPLSDIEDEVPDLKIPHGPMDPASKKLRGRTAADKESECLERFGRSENFESDTSGPEVGDAGAEADVEKPEHTESESPDLQTTPQKSKKRKRTKKNKNPKAQEDTSAPGSGSSRGRGSGRGQSRGSRGSRPPRGSQSGRSQPTDSRHNRSDRVKAREEAREIEQRQGLLDRGARALLEKVSAIVGPEAENRYALPADSPLRNPGGSAVSGVQPAPSMSTPRMPGGPRPQPGVRPTNPGTSARQQGPPPRPPGQTADHAVIPVAVDVGAEREAHRQAIADQNKQQNNNKQPRLIPEMTFEVTFWMSPRYMSIIGRPRVSWALLGRSLTPEDLKHTDLSLTARRSGRATGWSGLRMTQRRSGYVTFFGPRTSPRSSRRPSCVTAARP